MFESKEMNRLEKFVLLLQHVHVHDDEKSVNAAQQRWNDTDNSNNDDDNNTDNK